MKIIVKVVKQIILIFLCCGLCACDQDSRLGSQDKLTTPTDVVQLPTDRMSTPTFASNATMMVATISPTLTPNSTSTPPSTSTLLSPTDFQVEEKCVRLLSGPPVDASENGAIFLVDYHYSKPISRYDLITGKYTPLPYSEKGFPQVSLDRKYIAYEGSQEGIKRVFVANSTGEVITSLPWEDSWRLIAGWADRDRLMISRKISNPDFISGTDMTVIIDPFSGEQTDLPLPDNVYDLADGKDNWGGFTWTYSVYDPLISRVVYQGYSRPSQGLHLILRNILTDEKMGAARVYSRFAPKWSNDSSVFIFAGMMTQIPGKTTKISDELFSMDRDGVLKQLTTYSTQYPNQENSIYDYTISPDGKLVAYWVKYLPYESRSNSLPTASSMVLGSLSILSLDTGKVIDLCVPESTAFYSSAIWSPDSRYITTSIADYGETNGIYQGKVYIIDLEKLLVYPIAENRIPVGWMQP